jgi:hypothetical protein
MMLLGNQLLYSTFPIGSVSVESALLVARAETSRGLSGNYLIALRALSLLILQSYQLLETRSTCLLQGRTFFTHSEFEENF